MLGPLPPNKQMPLLLVVVALSALAFLSVTTSSVAVGMGGEAPCSQNDPFACSLAGQCLPNGTCECQPWTRGPDCAALNLVDLNSSADVTPLLLPAANWTRWGGSVVRDPTNSSVFHLFAAEMAFECGLGVWTYKSQVAHGVTHSGSPLGPFTRVGTAVPTEAHNPVLSRDPVDGTWLLWTCGCPAPPETQDCSPPHSGPLVCPGGAASQWTTTVYSSTSLDGPWEAHVDVLGNITRGRVRVRAKTT